VPISDPRQCHRTMGRWLWILRAKHFRIHSSSSMVSNGIVNSIFPFNSRNKNLVFCLKQDNQLDNILVDYSVLSCFQVLNKYIPSPQCIQKTCM
jgi:hypothetical protein